MADDAYYDREHLAHFADLGKNRLELAEKFFAYYGAVMGRARSVAAREALIALAVSHAVQCPYCIDAYSKNALEAGADLDQMTEAGARAAGRCAAAPAWCTACRCAAITTTCRCDRDPTMTGIHNAPSPLWGTLGRARAVAAAGEGGDHAAGQRRQAVQPGVPALPRRCRAAPSR